MDKRKETKLIAEFMGGEFNMSTKMIKAGKNVIDNHDGVDVYDDEYGEVECVTFPEKCIINFELRRLKYEESYDLLMEVLEKIESKGYETQLNSLEVNGEMEHNFIINKIGSGVHIVNRAKSDKKKVLYVGIVQFLKTVTLDK